MKHIFLVAGLLIGVSTFGQRWGQSNWGYHGNNFPVSNGYWNTGANNSFWSLALLPAQLFNTGASLIAGGIREVSWATRNSYGYGNNFFYGSAWNTPNYRRQYYNQVPTYQYVQPITPSPVFQTVVPLNPPSTIDLSQTALYEKKSVVTTQSCRWVLCTNYVTEYFLENGVYKTDAYGNYITRQVPKTSWVWSCQ
jgi:hypothetical protein